MFTQGNQGGLSNLKIGNNQNTLFGGNNQMQGSLFPNTNNQSNLYF